MITLIEATEVIATVSINLSTSPNLYKNDMLHLEIQISEDFPSLNIQVDITKNITVKDTILVIYNYINPEDILKAKAALLGYETCSMHTVDNIPIIVCIEKMF